MGRVSPRIRLALVLLGIAILLNIVVLAEGDTSPGWPLVAIIALGGAGISLLAERRPY